MFMHNAFIKIQVMLYAQRMLFQIHIVLLIMWSIQCRLNLVHYNNTFEEKASKKAILNV